jgi:hypothetical protein
VPTELAVLLDSPANLVGERVQVEGIVQVFDLTKQQIEAAG